MYSDKPKRTAELVTRICNEFYNNTPTGMIGNDDCGQMSAWYIFSVLGFYPVNPSSGEYVLGKSQVKSAKIHLPGGKLFQIINSNSNTVLLNQKPINRYFIKHAEITEDGVLNF
jgi:putative alpha-1,2-mannosidase